MLQTKSLLAIFICATLTGHSDRALATTDNCIAKISASTPGRHIISGSTTIENADATCIEIVDAKERYITVRYLESDNKIPLYMSSLGVGDVKTDMKFKGQNKDYKIALFPLFRSTRPYEFSVSIVVR